MSFPGRIETPCISVCRMVDDVCIGCRRTLVEITAWSRMSDEERAQIMAELDDRPTPQLPFAAGGRFAR